MQEKLSKNSLRPTVVILGTGGTIAGAGGSAASSSHYQPAQFGVRELLRAVPHLEGLATLEAEQIAQKPSFDLIQDDWHQLALATSQALARPEVAGVVITHGTDTLEETAFFLHLTIKSPKPVVLCGAMRPATAYSADGPANLFNAVTVALDTQAHHRGALVVMNERIHSAHHVTKNHSSSVIAFQSRSAGEIGYVSDGQSRFFADHREDSVSRTAAQLLSAANLTRQALPRVEIIYGHIGDSTAAIKAILATSPRAIVYAGVGNGNAPTPVKEILLEAHHQGILVARASRCQDGWITRNSAQFDDDLLGLITCNDLNPQKARILLQLGLAANGSASQIQLLFNQVCNAPS